MDRFLLLAPAVALFAIMAVALVVYGGLHAIGRPPQLEGVKHNELLGPFMAGYPVWRDWPVRRALGGRFSPESGAGVSPRAWGFPRVWARWGMCIGTGS